jgi:hypothetical protein
MKIAELFVQLGIKGNDKLKEGLTGAREGLGAVRSEGLAAKAAILAAFYGFQQMTAASNAAGASLSQFNAETGISTDKLQQWQYAGKLANAGAAEIEAGIRSVQNAMTQYQLTGIGPDKFPLLKTLVDFDDSKVKDTFYVLGKLQEAMKIVTEKYGPQYAATLGKSFGLSGNFIGAMNKGAFNEDVFKKANIYSQGQISALAKMSAQWDILGDKIEKAFGRLNAKHGGKLLKELSQLVDKTVQLTESLIKLAEVLKLFDLLKGSIGAATETVDYVNKTGVKITDNKAGPWEGFKDMIGKIIQDVDNVNMTAIPGGADKKKLFEESFIKGLGIQPQGNTNNVIVNQSMTFKTDGKDAAKVSEAARVGATKGTNEALRAFPNQGRAN